ncbi:MAG: type 1 glutamine amidotransferase domain-containing protein [Candidatus Asgardarchaeia archaeon]
MSLKGKKVAILAGKGFEEVELIYPYFRLLEEGAEVEILSRKGGEVPGKHGLPVESHKMIKDANPLDYDCVVIPGGWGPDRLRIHQPALEFVRKAYENGKVIAAICHGPQVLISAGIVKDKRCTGYAAVKDDLINAGAIYLDKPVVRDGNIITSRIPEDLPYFLPEIIKALRGE